MSEALGPSTRRAVIRIALAGAEVCWFAPFFLVFSQVGERHPTWLLWGSLFALMLVFCYLYQRLVAAQLSLWLQQGLLVVSLVVVIGLVLRFHVYAGPAQRGGIWIVELFRQLTDVTSVVPSGWAATMTLIYLWARGIHLARRSLSSESVGFSFRSGVIILMLIALVTHFVAEGESAVFIPAYFFFSLVAVALARVEDVSQMPNSSSSGYSGFWVGSTASIVLLLVAMGLVVSLVFQSQWFRQVLGLLQPVVVVIQIIFVAIGFLSLVLIQWVFGLLGINLGDLGAGFRDALSRLGNLLGTGQIVAPQETPQVRPNMLAILQGSVTIGIPVLLILIVVLITWQRVRRAQKNRDGESRESLLTGAVLADKIRKAIQTRQERLRELAGLVSQFGIGPRFLSAVSIRRIYANLVRMATHAGYPRLPAQTPLEYMDTLLDMLPHSESDLLTVTRAYINARYGQVPDTREELQRIRACWERIRTQDIQEPLSSL